MNETYSINLYGEWVVFNVTSDDDYGIKWSPKTGNKCFDKLIQQTEWIHEDIEIKILDAMRKRNDDTLIERLL